MAILRIPLNKFVSKYTRLTSSPNLSSLYLAPERRATIIIFAQITNQTNATRSISFGISANNEVYYFAENFDVPPRDARALITGRAVIRGIDNIDIFTPEFLVARDVTQNTSTLGLTGLTLTLGLLETINVD